MQLLAVYAMLPAQVNAPARMATRRLTSTLPATATHDHKHARPYVKMVSFESMYVAIHARKASCGARAHFQVLHAGPVNTDASA